jgi:uncharacterized protein YjbK
MDRHVEVEVKYQLTAPAHADLARHLRELLGEPRRLEQENRFFDTADLRLRRQGLNLRLRREGGRVLLTCKAARRGSTPSLHQHDEWEAWIDPVWFDHLGLPSAGLPSAGLPPLPPLPPRWLAALDECRVHLHGGFANTRLEFSPRPEAPPASASAGSASEPARQPAGQELLCLDHSVFPGRHEDYELEIETSAPEVTIPAWEARLNAWRIAWCPQSRSKFTRFLAALAATRSERAGG